MRFQLTEDQAALQDAARRFATERLAPDYMAREASGEGSIDPALIREMGELGLIGADLPEEHGGLGVDGVT
ncbi:MAG: acyl-CoA dehydrogenase family protein, partial [Alphaproteobacteria bacterium]|nr:acyl-CoA dehydrogenase family protein [Alphaproteobacteria bacterium]